VIDRGILAGFTGSKSSVRMTGWKSSASVTPVSIAREQIEQSSPRSAESGRGFPQHGQAGIIVAPVLSL
jgi:hypothetical protein